MNGNAITKNLITKFNMEMFDLSGVDIIVSFIKKSGYDKLEPFLKSVLNKNIPIRVLTSTYMSITDPIALSKLLDLLGEGNVKLYNGGAPSFHPKAYFFKNGKNIEKSYILIGSSNISEPALTNGIEWNYQVNCSDDFNAYNYYQNQFEDLFYNCSYTMTEKNIKEYRDTLIVQKENDSNMNTNKHYIQHTLLSNKIRENRVENLFRPNQAQEEALFELEKTREDGNKKALIVAATGIGKTFLAAFDSQLFESVLFIAHREEILNQAYETFAKVRGNKNLGKYFGNIHDLDKTILFASVQTLSREEHLLKFKHSSFKYIIIDEFHHAKANTYRKILDYFKPEFLLGLTATPHRLDKKDVLELCDYNIPYEANLFSSINRDWLVPFYYYGIYDDTVKYDNISFINGKYIEKELSKALRIERRSELIYKNYMKHRRNCTIGFCVDIDHAEAMADFFNKKGVLASTIHSDYSRKHIEERKEAIRKLKSGEIEIIFAVDMLNEGVDIPNIDLLLFLRPTESPTVFLQQLGRGLRHCENKVRLKVLDFIGNYKNVEMLPFWLSGKTANNAFEKRQIVEGLLKQDIIPKGCYVDFDLQVIDLFEKMFKSKLKIKELIEGLYFECKSLNCHIPTRVEFFKHLDNINYINLKKSSKLNPFKNYLKFISQVEKNYISKEFLNSDAFRYINMLETTSMQSLYKIAIFKTFLSNNTMNKEITRKQIEQSFYDFYRSKRHWPDLDRYKTRNDFRNWKPKDYWELAQENPIYYLCKTHNEIFEYDKDNFKMKIKIDIDKWLNNDFFINQIKDIIEFRRIEFLDKRLNQKSYEYSNKQVEYKI